MEIGERIKNRREALNMSQEELAHKVGYKSRSSINKIESDGRGLPQSKIIAFAKALDTSPAYLMGWDNNAIRLMSGIDSVIKNLEGNNSIIKTLELDTTEMNESPKHTKGVKINVLGRVAAGFPIEAVENIIDTEEISEEMARTGEFFGLQIKGDSMEPRIYENDIVIVRKQEDAESGDIVIALVNGNDATCKRLIKYAGGISLVALNSAKYEPLMFSNEEIVEKPIKIIGKVVELRGKL